MSLQNFSECGSKIRKRSLKPMPEQQFVSNRSIDAMRCWCSWWKKNFWCVTMTGGHTTPKTSLGIFMQMRHLKSHVYCREIESKSPNIFPRSAVVRFTPNNFLEKLSQDLRPCHWSPWISDQKKCKQLVDNKYLLVVIHRELPRLIKAPGVFWIQTSFIFRIFCYIEDDLWGVGIGLG